MEFFFHLLATVAMSIPYVLGYNLIFGKARILHFGPIGVDVAAVYACFLTLSATGSYLAGFGAGLLAALAVSALFAWLSFRLDPDGLGILSIATHLGMLTIVLNWSSVTRGALGLPGIPRMPFLTAIEPFVAVVSLIAMGWIALMWWIHRSALGRKLQTLSECEWHATSLGISRTKAHLAAFLIGGIGALLSTVFYHQYLHLVHPNDLGFPALIFLVMIVVAGKPGSVFGVSIATALLVLLKEGLRFLPLPADVLGPVRLLLFGMILLAAVWIQRDTLFPKKRTI